MTNTLHTTKHILALAEKLHAKDAKECSYPISAESYAHILENIKRAMLSGNFYIGVFKVSHSGMSRTLAMGYMHGGKLWAINDPHILKLAGCDRNGRIGGCGMDMLFHAQHTLFHNLHANYKQARYQKRMAQYNLLPGSL